MKITQIVVAVLLAGAVAYAGGSKNFGKALTLKETTKISDIYAHPQQFAGKRVLVEGPVVNVCKKRGCWIEIGSDKEFQSIRFKVDDGVIVFPLETGGKTARAEGVVNVTTYTVEELIKQGEHQAEETGKAFDPASIKGPKTIVMLKGEGAEVR